MNDKKVSDHHALIPTLELKKADVPALPVGERNILLLVCCKLLCAAAEPFVYEAVTAIDNELVAEAFSALPQAEQSILILHCTLDLTDGEIGNLVGMSRSAVQRHRTRALQELREALSALMPKGG